MDKYRIALPEFHGPLDLLLHLVKRNEVDVRDIPMAVIAEQFRTYLEVIRVIDVELAGEFLVTASVLMEIKSKMLLPQTRGEPENADTDDPRVELVQQLLEYQRMRQSIVRMEALANQNNRRFGHVAVNSMHADEVSATGVEVVELWDLLSAFGRIIRESEDVTSTNEEDATPQQVYRDRLMQQIQLNGRIKFREAFTPPFHRNRLVGVFLAILELIKVGAITLEVAEPSKELFLVAAPQTKIL